MRRNGTKIDAQKMQKAVLTVSLSMTILLLVMVSWTVTIAAQERLIPNKYLKVTPGVTTRPDIEKLYGRGDPSHFFVDYIIPEGVVSVTYSSGGCEQGKKSRGIPKWTVEEISYDNADNIVPLKNVIFDLSRFQKRESEHVIGHVTYFNDKAGISVSYDEKFNTVQAITIRLGSDAEKKFACK
ncbi:MAG: hypothetical protein ACRD6X_17940 [Pyrinomonadaceae bacterium]